jgi:hypothetical protein
VSRKATVVIALLAVAAALRIGDTWRRFSQTHDEPHHVACGLEWIEDGAYRMEPQHPPLARIFDAIALFAAGRRLPRHDMVITTPVVLSLGNDVFNEGDYTRNLVLARAGVLPFFLLAVLVVAAWAWRLGGPRAAIIAVLLYTTLPPVLAHAGVATTDMAAAATVPAAIFAFALWLETRSWRNATLFGVAMAAALLAKFSSIPFCAVAMLLIVVWRSVMHVRYGAPSSGASRHLLPRGEGTEDHDFQSPLPTGEGGRRPVEGRRRRTLQFAAVTACIALLTWACYRFTIWPDPIFNFPPDAILAALADKHDLTDRALYHLLNLGPIPAPSFFVGLAQLQDHMAKGHPSYLLGRVSDSGWWNYFPVAISVKTPLPFLLISIPASIWMMRRRSWPLAAPALSALAILGVAMTTRIDIGIRHVLPLYAPLAVCAGAGVAQLWSATMQRGVRTLLVLLIAWQVISSTLAHPDYLAWFNELAGAHPDAILVDSNLDWGQDLPRLREAIRENHISVLWLKYFGSTDLARYPLGAQFRMLPKSQRVHGWIAISRTYLAGVYDGPVYAWLKNETPVAEVGKSMLLYYVP